jgi:hypothetical protein
MPEVLAPVLLRPLGPAYVQALQDEVFLMSELMMIRPPSDLFEFVREVGQASFLDAWIPRVAIELGCEASEDAIRERCAGEWYDDEREQFEMWALQILDRAVSRAATVRNAVAGNLDDRRRAKAEAAAAAAAAAETFDLEAAKAWYRKNEPEMVAEFMCDLLDEEFGGANAA